MEVSKKYMSYILTSILTALIYRPDTLQPHDSPFVASEDQIQDLYGDNVNAAGWLLDDYQLQQGDNLGDEHHEHNSDLSDPQ